MSDFLDTAIMAHNQWKSRLHSAIDGGEVPDVQKVDADNQCDLGKWIYGDGRKFQALPEYEEVKTKHAQFHHAAAAVIKLIKAGNKAAAVQDLDKGEYHRASTSVVVAIAMLKQKKVA